MSQKIIFIIILLLAGQLNLYSQPQPVWTNTFNGSNNNNDKAFKTVLDALMLPLK